MGSQYLNGKTLFAFRKSESAKEEHKTWANQ